MKRYILLFLVFCALTACKTAQRVVVEYKERVRVDTLQRVDSVYVSKVQFVKGDTMYILDTLRTFKIVEKVKVEQVRDSVPYCVEVVKEVRKRNWYDRATSWGFWIVSVCFAGYVTYKIIRKRWFLF